MKNQHHSEVVRGGIDPLPDPSQLSNLAGYVTVSRPGEDGMPLVESPPSVLCRLPSCVEDPQAGALQPEEEVPAPLVVPTACV